MPEATLKATLLNHTQKPEETVALAGRLCYSQVGVVELRKKMSPQEKAKLLRLLFSSGHLSPFEHAGFTFGVEGISRACSHQLVRHRIASYSQQSQRYVKADNFPYIIPPQIKKDKKLKEEFIEDMKKSAARYKHYVKALEKTRSKEQAQEDARFVLPNAAETKIVVTMNARELIHTANVRLCNRAQWEIRHLFAAMRKEVRKVAPTVASFMASKCDKQFLGYCPEGRLSCGKTRTKEELFGK